MVRHFYSKNKVLFTFLLVLLVAQKSMAQVSAYVFTQTTATYTALTGGTVVATATGTTGAASLDDVIYDLPAGTIPFNFLYDNVNYTGCKISTNGFITFGTTAPAANGSSTGYTPLSAVTAYSGAASALGRNLNAYFFSGNAAQTGEIRYQTLGSAPNRTFVIQWRNFKTFNTSGTTFGPVLNFQVRLSETTNAISFVYSCSGNFGASTAQVGLRGASNGFPSNINNRSVVSGVNSWITSAAGTSNTSSCEFSGSLLPPAGLTYTFAPALCPAPLNPSATNITQNSASLVWTSGGGSGTFSIEYGLAGFPQGTGTVQTNVSSGVIISGLASTTNYQFYVRQVCLGNGNSAWVGPVNFSTGGPGEDCITALSLNVAASLAACSFTTVNSGVSSNGPNAICSDANGNGANDDKWYKFTAPATGNKLVITTTAGTVNDWVMEVWNGCPGNGSLLQCSDDVNGGMPEITLCQNQFTPGQQLYVRIWTYSTTAIGSCNLCVYQATPCPLPPANDECISATRLFVNPPLSCPASASTHTTANATPNTDAATCDAGTKRDVWFVFNTGNFGDLRMTIAPGTATTLKAQLLFECGGFEISCFSPANGTYTFTGLNPQADYIIRVWSDTLTGGTFSICLSDICANPTASVSGSQSICSGSTATVPVSFTGVPPFSFSYRNNSTNQTFNVNTSSNPFNLQLSPTATTSYTLLSMSDAACSGTVSGTATVNVVTPQTVTLLPFTPVCENITSVSLTGGSPAGGVYTGTGVSGNIFNTSGGSQTITYTVTFAPGCTGSASQLFTVNALPNVVLNPITNICSNATPFTLTNGTPSGGTYTGTGITNNVFSPALAGLGTKVVNYTFTSTSGCTGSDTSTITVVSCSTCSNPPAANAGANINACGTGGVSLSGSVSGSATSATWSGGAGSFSPNASSLTATYTPTAAEISNGTLNLILTTNDPDGTGPCVAAKDTVRITFLPAPSVSAISGNGSVCTGQSGVIYSVTAQTGYTYSWTVPAGATVTTGQGSSTIGTAWSASAVSGNVTVVANNSCGSVTALLAVSVSSAPTAATISGASQVCLPQSGVTFSVSAQPGVSYAWSVPAGVTISGGAGTNSITTNWTTSAVAGNVSVTLSSACGTVSASRPVSIGILPATPSITGVTQVCQGATGVAFSITAQTGVTYNWTVPSGVTITSGQGTNAINTSWSGTAVSGNVNVAVTNSCGTVNASRAVTVSAAPAATSVSGSALVCLPQGAVTYSVPAQAGVTYAWTVPSGVTVTSGAGTNSIVTSWSASAVAGNVSVTVTNSCGSVSAQLAVSTGQLPATPTVSGAAQVCQGTTGVAYSIAAQTGVAYTWTVPSGVTITSGQGTNAINTSWSGTAVSGNVNVAVTNSCGTVNASRAVTVTPAPVTPVVSGPATSCPGTNGLVYSIPAQTGVTYAWTVPSGVTISAGQGTNSITTNWGAGAVAGAVIVTVSNACGNASGSISVTLSGAISIGAISGQSPLCRPATGVIYSVTNVTGATYAWTVPAGVTITAGQGTGSITTSWSNSAVTGTISVVATTTCGSATASRSVTVRTAVPATPGTIGGTSSACRGDVATFTIARVSTADFYVWTPPPGTTINGSASPFTTPDTFVVVTFLQTFNSDTLRVRSGNCRGQSTSARTKAISRRTTAPGTPGTLTGQSSGLCGVTSVTYAMPAVISGAINYTWRIKLTGALINGLPSPVTVPANQLSVVITYPAGWNGVDTIFVRSNNGCGSSTERSLRVISRPGQPGTITGPTPVCVSATNQSYTCGTTVGATAYTWTIPSGITLAAGQGTNTVALNFNATAATRTISVVANNACGAGSSRTLSVTSQTCPRLALNGSISTLDVYPNPATDLVTVMVQMAAAENMRLTLTDISGRTVFTDARSFAEGPSQFNLDVATLSNGVYLLSLQGTTGIYKTRLVVEK